MMEDGSTPAVTLGVSPDSRSTVHAGTAFELQVAGKRLGALVETLAVNGQTAPVVVERALYRDVKGIWWAAGTNALATRLRVVARLTVRGAQA